MNIVFLDIDGVLNSDLWIKTSSFKKGSAPYNQFDPRNIKLLNRLLKETQAKIVLTSTWRLHHTLEEMNAIFSTLQLESTIIGMTPDLKKASPAMLRGNEILQWCMDNEPILGCTYKQYRQYIILDDHTDMLYWQRNHFIQTDRYCGITATQIKLGIELLGKK